MRKFGLLITVLFVLAGMAAPPTLAGSVQEVAEGSRNTRDIAELTDVAKDRPLTLTTTVLGCLIGIVFPPIIPLTCAIGWGVGEVVEGGGP